MLHGKKNHRGWEPAVGDLESVGESFCTMEAKGHNGTMGCNGEDRNRRDSGVLGHKYPQTIKSVPSAAMRRQKVDLAVCREQDRMTSGSGLRLSSCPASYCPSKMTACGQNALARIGRFPLFITDPSWPSLRWILETLFPYRSLREGMNPSKAETAICSWTFPGNSSG